MNIKFKSVIFAVWEKSMCQKPDLSFSGIFGVG